MTPKSGGKRFYWFFYGIWVFFALKREIWSKKEFFLREPCEFLVNKKLKDLLLQQLENHVLVGTQLIVALLV